MKCKNCGHDNEGGRFCENCGTPLAVETEQYTTQNPQTQPTNQMNNGNAGGDSQTEDYLKKTKDQSKQYFAYFRDALKKPYASLDATMGSQHFIHAIITLILYCLLVPLTIYFGIKGLLSNVDPFGLGSGMDIDPPFMDIVIKPVLAFAILIMLVIAFTFISIKLGQVNVAFKDVLTRFGILLVPFVFILAIGLILAILEVSTFTYFVGIGLMGSMYIAVPLLIVFYKKNSVGKGLDVVYGTLLSYILTMIALKIMGDMLFDSLLTGIDSFMNGSYFGF